MCTSCVIEEIKVMNISGINVKYKLVIIDGKIKIKIDRLTPKFNSLIELKDNSSLLKRRELFDEWYFEINDKLGHDIYKASKGSMKVAWWVCSDCGSPYDMEIAYRTKGFNCPFCAGRRVNITNSLESIRPDIAKEWDYDKNDRLPNEVVCNSRDVIWWKCKDCDESYDMPIYNKSKGKGCRYCSGKAVTISNCLETKNPILAKEWHPTKNGDLTPYNVTSGEGRIVWWLCSKCGTSYDMSLNDRSSKNCNCPYCNGRRINSTNSLLSKNPKISLQWHPSLNGELTPKNTHCHSSEVVWWLCDVCGYEWENAVRNRRSGNDECPECSKLINKAPHIAKLLLNKKDAHIYTIGSNVKVDWKCSCGNIIKNKAINEITNKGHLPCPSCSDGKSYPEKFMYNLLKLINIEFTWEKNF